MLFRLLIVLCFGVLGALSSSAKSLHGSARHHCNKRKIELTSGRYAIVPRLSGQALEVDHASMINGAKIRQGPYNHSLHQQFDVTYLGRGRYSIRPAHSEKSLSIRDWYHAVRQGVFKGSSNQLWEVQAVGCNDVIIKSSFNHKVLEVSRSGRVNGNYLRQAVYTGRIRQHFRFIQARDMYDESQNLTLVWSDEFNYRGLPREDYWGYEEGMVRNSEAQYYTVERGENAWVEDGVLTITALREPYGGAAYTSASINTAGKYDWTYGRFEMRAKIDVRDGLWPAFWMLGYGKWPENGEIDIMEYYQKKILANVAWKANNSDPWSAQWDSATRSLESLRRIYPNWENEFHVWTMDWDTSSVRLFVDGALLNEAYLTDIINPDGSNPFLDKPLYLLINLAIGGTQGGNPEGTAFPAKYEVDYIRVFQ